MRKVQKKELRAAAQLMAECFCDYPLYKAFFPNDAKRKRQLLYFCWYYVFVRQNFAYLSEDNASLLIFQKPGERFAHPAALLLNPSFLLGALGNLPISSLLMLPGYAKMTAGESRRFFHEKEDWFVHVLCVSGRGRGSSFLNIIHEMDEGEPLFCFTHSPRNARLYKLIGFDVLNETQWHGITVYTMRRERKYDKCGSST